MNAREAVVDNNQVVLIKGYPKSWKEILEELFRPTTTREKKSAAERRTRIPMNNCAKNGSMPTQPGKLKADLYL
jgi:hypothetical protein